jgi:hypothetical protein
VALAFEAASMADVRNRSESTLAHAILRPRPWYPFSIGCLVFVIAVSGLLLTFIIMVGLVKDQSDMSWRTHRNLERVVTALKAYHDDYGSFPPAVVTDASGKPLYSWRVLLLPYVPESDERNMPPFDLSQSWDSEANRAASAYWHTSFDNPRREGQCVVYATVGKETMFPPEGCRKLSNVTDDPAQTMVLVSVFGRTQSWAAPGDVNVDDGPLIGRTVDIPANGDYRVGSQAGFLGGGAIRLPTSVKDETLRAAASIAGGEAVIWRP